MKINKNNKIKKVAVVIVQNTNNQFFVVKRNRNKKVFPSLYGIGSGGKVEKTKQ